MNGSILSDEALERLAAVLTGVLETGSSELPRPEVRRLALRGALLALPAVLAMQKVQEWVRANGRPGAWDGMLHRGCLMSPSSKRTEVPEMFQGSGGLRVQQTSRAGWRLIRATVEVQVGGWCWQVAHELARRVSADRLAARAQGKFTDPGAGSDLFAGTRFFRLRIEDVIAWAEATGDRNAIHFLPGGAAQAGLRAGPDGVVAHGLLLGALSLAVSVPSPSQPIRLRFIDSADIPATHQDGRSSWARLAVDPGSGDVAQGGRSVMRRW